MGEHCHKKSGPMLEGLAHIAVYTDDIEKSIEFYEDILCFECADRYELNRADGVLKIAFIVMGDVVIELLQPPTGTQGMSRNGVCQHIAIQVTGIDEIVESMKELGVEFETAEAGLIPEMFGGSKSIFFAGPSGERLELFEYGEYADDCDCGCCDGDCDCEDCDCDDCDCDCDGDDDCDCGCHHNH